MKSAKIARLSQDAQIVAVAPTILPNWRYSQNKWSFMLFPKTFYKHS